MDRKITIPAVTESIEIITAFIEEKMELQECPMKVMMQIDVVIDELFSNIARYAYPDETGEASVSIEFPEDPRAVKLVFTDRGRAYNPLDLESPDITLSAEEREIGGLGLLIVKKTMDEVSYCFENGENRLTVIKYY